MQSGSAEEHQVLYNHETLKSLFETAGFRVRMLEYFDSAGKFQSAEWDAGGGKIHRSARFQR